jgi:hypothetical protein
VPRTLKRLERHFQHLDVATYTIVVVRATQFRAPGPILLLEGRMAVFTTPCPYPFHQPTQAFPGCLALDHPVSTACCGPLVGQSKKIDCPRTPCRWVSAWWLLARHQRRLFRMHGPAKTMQPFRQDIHHPLGIRLERAANAAIIGTTCHKASALHPGLHVFDTPVVQDMRQEDIGKHGRDHSPYKVANFFFQDRHRRDRDRPETQY